MSAAVCGERDATTSADVWTQALEVIKKVLESSLEGELSGLVRELKQRNFVIICMGLTPNSNFDRVIINHPRLRDINKLIKKHESASNLAYDIYRHNDVHRANDLVRVWTEVCEVMLQALEYEVAKEHTQKLKVEWTNLEIDWERRAQYWRDRIPSYIKSARKT